MRLRAKLTYSNVISTVCLFLLVGGGTAFAASQLGKESVGTNQLKKAAVTPAKLSAAAKQGMQGPAGPQGQQGPKGATGAAGAKGATGAQGPKGDTGDRGETGAQGPKGDTGERGEDGNADVFVYNAGSHTFTEATNKTAVVVATLPGSLAEWEEGAWQIQGSTLTASYSFPGPGVGATSEFTANLEEASPTSVKVVVSRFLGTTDETLNIKVTRVVGTLLTTQG
jgi:hypothetical protein